MTSEIHLSNIKIYAYHGCLPEENVIGAWYVVNLRVEVDLTQAGKTDDLQHTINYADLSEIIHRRMKQKSNLLEKVCYDILVEIKNYSDQIEGAEIQLAKLDPPMPGNIERASVKMYQKFKPKIHF
ncbi:dihydroneopterin aldolase [Ornithobacterium rhinotracheale]|uniref:dihydroneopterin aldolase n=1 Tax=Ornithobacterium rhinotracheale TaxID=28251 RepID=UPI003FD556D8